MLKGYNAYMYRNGIQNVCVFFTYVGCKDELYLETTIWFRNVFGMGSVVIQCYLAFDYSTQADL